ncbi:MAG: glutamine amidotransferase [Deltaproteobacteria bacterium]|nr:glutamine amidotransferase [Deltaproteobacteria bacterium]
MECLVIQHVSFETLGIFEPILKDSGFNVTYIQAGVDTLSQEQWLKSDLGIILGGPIGVLQLDIYPFLQDELLLTKARLSSGKPLLGICLGAQLMAAALGSAVYPGPEKEIGWGQVEITDEGLKTPLRHLLGAPVLHWHGDTFVLPSGTKNLASSSITENQAFKAARGQLALQFHPEMDSDRIETWLIGHCCELQGSKIDPNSIRYDAQTLGSQARTAGESFLKCWLAEEVLEPSQKR